MLFIVSKETLKILLCGLFFWLYIRYWLPINLWYQIIDQSFKRRRFTLFDSFLLLSELFNFIHSCLITQRNSSFNLYFFLFFRFLKDPSFFLRLCNCLIWRRNRHFSWNCLRKRWIYSFFNLINNQFVFNKIWMMNPLIS